tara:strand:+ start:1340 stop:1477 length:138 start_codon:yes stop_codon:yes gene_type:complete
MTNYFIWLLGVVLWNFGFPAAPPIFDVIAAVLLSMISIYLHRVVK